MLNLKLLTDINFFFFQLDEHLHVSKTLEDPGENHFKIHSETLTDDFAPH